MGVISAFCCASGLDGARFCFVKQSCTRILCLLMGAGPWLFFFLVTPVVLCLAHGWVLAFLFASGLGLDFGILLVGEAVFLMFFS